MIATSTLGIFVIPLLYMLFQSMREKLKGGISGLPFRRKHLKEERRQEQSVL